MLEDLDITDDAAWDAWYDAYFSSTTHGRPFHAAYSSPALRALLAGEPGFRHRLVSAIADGRVVGFADLALPQLDNRALATLQVGVVPDARRQGVGTGLLAELERTAREDGRSVLVSEVDHPVDPADGAGHPGVEFLRRHGFSYGLGNIQRILDLPVAAGLLDRLEAQAAPRHARYTFLDVTGRLPDELVLPVGRIRAAVETEAPMGEIPREPPHVDAERVRAEEQVIAEMGRQTFATLAFAPDGSLAAYTEVAVSERDPDWAYQWGTLAYREHRGHALGLATKVRNTRWVQELFPTKRGIRTWNADVNAPMVAVNDLLGYRPVERLSEWQKPLRAS